MSRAFFDQVADALIGFLPPSLRSFSARTGSRNLKVWYGEEENEHYEVQLIARAALRAARVPGIGPALEVGFHAEHPDAARNEEVLQRVRAREETLRKALGPEPAFAAFAGRQREWRRISELWEGGELTGDGAAIEAAERLAAYIRVIESVKNPSARPARPR